MSGLILALRCDATGCLGVLATVEGELVTTARARQAPLRSYAGFLALDVDGTLERVHEVLGRLAARDTGDRSVEAIALVTPPRTALLVGSENVFQTPILFGVGSPLSARSVPSDFADDPVAAELYRNSPVRQVGEREPSAVLDVQRVTSLGALLHRELTGAWVDVSAGAPTGLPWDFQTEAHYSRDDMHWHAVGADPRTVPLCVPPAGIAGQLTPQMARKYGWRAGTPLVATSDDFGCLAYGFKSNGAGWVIELGDGMRTGWTGPAPTGDLVSIQIVDPSETEQPATEGDDGDGEATADASGGADDVTASEVPDERALRGDGGARADGADPTDVGGGDDGPSSATAGPDATEEEPSEPPVETDEAEEESPELSLEAVSRYVHAALSDRIDVAPGPRTEMARFEIRAACGLFGPHAGPIPVTTAPGDEDAVALVRRQVFERVPVGADGMRFVPGRDTGVLLGARAGHTQAHVARAVLEGLLLEARRLRRMTGVTGADMPRLVLRPPWTIEQATLVADVLGEPIMLWQGEPELPSLLGAVLAVSRGLQLHPDPSPSLTVRRVDPGARAESYARQFAVHVALVDALDIALY